MCDANRRTKRTRRAKVRPPLRAGGAVKPHNAGAALLRVRWHLRFRSPGEISLNRCKEKAQGLTEYALILAIVAVLAISALILYGGSVGRLLSSLGTSVNCLYCANP